MISADYAAKLFSKFIHFNEKFSDKELRRYIYFLTYQVAFMSGIPEYSLMRRDMLDQLNVCRGWAEARNMKI